jgi:hypothetical protein
MTEVHNLNPKIPLCTAAYEPLGNKLFQLILTKENKAEIFEHGLTKLRKNQHEASDVLEILEKWDPLTRSLFTLRSPSTILDTPFRLVYPMTDKSSFDETGFYVRQYMAVSYCWRSKDFLPVGYERHDGWPVSKPFVDAMIGEKNHPRVGIWMDQLCINQDSAEDKRSSVAAMDVIYRSCIRLLVLLEDVFLDEAEIALHSKYDLPRAQYDPAWRPPAHEEPVIASFYRKVASARWWERAWCFHEFNTNEPWTDKRQCNEIHNATFIMNGPNGSTVKIKWWTLHFIMCLASHEERIQEIFIPVDHGDREPGFRGSIMARHNAVSTKGCMLLEDRLSIMVNLSGLALAYQGQTRQSAEEVMYISAVLAMAAGEAYPLTMFGGPIIPAMRESWFQRHLLNDVTIPKFRLRDLKGVHRVSMQNIELDMIFLLPPAAWRGVEDEDLDPTYRIFPKTIATTLPATHGPTSEVLTTARRPDEDLDKPRRKFLAGCLMNGPDFTARLWTQLRTDVIGPNYNQGLFKELAPNPSLLPAAIELLRQLFPVTTLLTIPASSEFNIEDAQLFLTWLTDPRSLYYIGVFTYQIQRGLGGQGAFTTGAQVNAHFTDGPSDELVAAVPIDLFDMSCIPLRIWLLRPCKGKGATSQWRLVGKALLLGEPDLRMEARKSKGRDDAAVEFRRVIVGG